MSVHHEKVKKELFEVLDHIKYDVPDTPEKFKAHECVKEAILWLSGPEIFRKQDGS